MTKWKDLQDTNPEPSLLDAIAHAEQQQQVFLATGWNGDYPQYFYPFTDPDEAMQFVELAQAHVDDVDRWEIITETVRTARQTYDAHRAWVEE